VLYFIVLTQRCNLKCIYCGNEPQEEYGPENAEFSIEDLKKFISQDPEANIEFYGGEPLLNIPLMLKIMDEVPANHYMIQTNATILRRVPPEYLKRFDVILASIDGRPEINDYYRGKGTYNRVLDNLRYARSVGFKGDLIARMAVSEHSSIYDEVIHLLSLDDPKFDHVHWQLDVEWSYPMELTWKDFDGWVNNNYNPGITKLIDFWISHMKKGEVLGIVPFQNIMQSLITGEKAHLRCGSGIDSFTITTNGKITACPILPANEISNLGDIRTTFYLDLPGKESIGEPCLSCDIYDICGGRCLYANKTKLWGEEGFLKVCKTVRHLINELKRVKPIVEELLNTQIIDKDDLFYPPYNNGCEIIP